MEDIHLDKMKIYLNSYYAMNFIRELLKNKSSKEKVLSYLRKINKDYSYNLFDTNMDKLVKDNFIEVKDDDDLEILSMKSLMKPLVFILRQQIITRK